MKPETVPAHDLMPQGRAMPDGPARRELRDAAAALDLAERFHQPLEMALALAQMARSYKALQAHGPAELMLERALAWARLLGAADPAVEILCLLAECNCSMAEAHRHSDARCGHAALERTRDRAFEAVREAAHVADPQWEIKVLLRVSDVLDRCGDHDDAVQLQSRAMRLMYVPHLGTEAPGASVPGAPRPTEG
jgi:tetratricopeptide (TPR) repeat protein